MVVTRSSVLSRSMPGIADLLLAARAAGALTGLASTALAAAALAGHPEVVVWVWPVPAAFLAFAIAARTRWAALAVLTLPPVVLGASGIKAAALDHRAGTAVVRVYEVPSPGAPAVSPDGRPVEYMGRAPLGHEVFRDAGYEATLRLLR